MKSITKIEIINRNRKALTIGLVILLVINIAGYFIYQFSTAQMTEALNRKGLEEAENLATKSGPYVLEKDILSLNVAVKELKTVKDLKFAVIMDHKNNILAHTDPDMTNQKFERMQNEKIDINKLAKQEDLSWMRRQIIERCTEIIKRLAA